MRALWSAALALLLGNLLGNVALGAQQSAAGTLTLSGRIVHAEGDAAAAYGTIEVVEPGIRRFTDAQGAFALSGLAPGTYHVRARQLGFAPLDTVLLLGPATGPLVLRLHAVPILLGSVRVTARGSCSRAQSDTVGDPALAAILAAVRDNAEREVLLRRAYPFVFHLEATQTADEGGRRVQHDVDTLHFRSDAFLPYRRGSIVFVDSSTSGRVRRRMRLPSTVDFADPAFLASHCLTYTGLEHGAYQIAFTPLESIFTPDVEGTISLDSATFVVRSAIIRLTRPWKLDPELTSVEARTLYREVLPAVAIPADIRTTQRYQRARGEAVGTEVQRMLSLSFAGLVPDGWIAGPINH